jgi:hypothetical protein
MTIQFWGWTQFWPMPIKRSAKHCSVVPRWTQEVLAVSRRPLDPIGLHLSKWCFYSWLVTSPSFWYVLVSKIPQFSVLTPQLSLASLSIQFHYINYYYYYYYYCYYYYYYNPSKKHSSIRVINRWFHVTRGRISIPDRRPRLTSASTSTVGVDPRATPGVPSTPNRRFKHVGIQDHNDHTHVS